MCTVSSKFQIRGADSH